MNNIYLNTLEQFNRLKFIVLGDGMLDIYIRGTSQRLCREAPVPIVSVKTKEILPGGAANTAVNIKSLGAYCYFISAIGNDLEGESVYKLLESYHVDVSRVEKENRQTLSKHRIFSQNQQLLRFDYGSYQKISSKIEQNMIESLSLLYPSCDGIIISDYGYGVITQRIIEELKQLQDRYQKILVVDAKKPESYQPLNPTLVKPNFEEAISLLQLDNYTTTDRINFIHLYQEEILKKTGAKIAAVTVDREGSIIFQHHNDSFKTPTTSVDNTKTAGAGDTYTAMFALSLAAHAPTSLAAQLAATAAEVVIQKDFTAVCNKLEVYYHYLSGEKQISKIDIKIFIDTIKKNNKRIVFTNGCFDILHSGHINYLAQAKKLGDILIIGVNTDESVKKLKGIDRPVNTLLDRVNVLAGLASVDHVIAFSEDNPIALIKEIRPDVYVKGGDYTRETLPEVPIVESLGGKVEIIPYVKDHSTTQIIEQIRSHKNQQADAYTYEQKLAKL